MKTRYKIPLLYPNYELKPLAVITVNIQKNSFQKMWLLPRLKDNKRYTGKVSSFTAQVFTHFFANIDSIIKM